MDTTSETQPLDRDRWMAWGGPGFLLLFIVALALAGGNIAEDATGKHVIASIAEHKDASFAGVFLTAPVVALLLLFVARLRTLTGPAAGAGRHLLQYGAVLYAAAIAAGGVVELGLVAATDHKQEGVAETLNVLNNDGWIPLTIGIAVLLLGAGISVLRTAVLPRWMGWVALVVGIISLLGPGGFVGFFVGPLWIAAAGIMLAVRKDVPAR